jgi:hypothetical protein
MDRLNERFDGEKRPKDKVTLWVTLVYTLTFTCPKTFTLGHVNVSKKNYIHANNVSVNVKSLDV